jgi:hypothetical protein
MAKVRLTVTYTYEYEIVPEYYDNCDTDEQRMNQDIESYRNEPTMLDMMDAKTFDIKGELMK